MTRPRTEVRTWHPPAGLPPQVQDPAMREFLRELRRALLVGLDTERGRNMAIAAIDKALG